MNPDENSPNLHPSVESLPGPTGARLSRRCFVMRTAAGLGGCACGLGLGPLIAAEAEARCPDLISPGCRKSKVRVAKVFLGKPNAHWPNPAMDIGAERNRYELDLGRMAEDFADVDFVLDELLTDKAQVEPLREKLQTVDGILAIHLSMGVREIIEALLSSRKPTALFAAPYSGHEWTRFGELQRGEHGQYLDCLLTSDRAQLAAAVRPFRALHHLREAKILNLTARTEISERVQAIAGKFGTQIQRLELGRTQAAYEAVDEALAERETKRWIRGAEKVVEPSRDEIQRSCRLALAFERLLEEEQATVMTVDCYGSMYQKLPAFPCVGFVRLNNMGLGGICESDLVSALTFILLQGLSGRPGFISDPTLDMSVPGIILAHCLGTLKMDGPDGDAAPYRLRTIMERQEGCVPQVRMRLGQRVTQTLLAEADQLLYFTGRIVDTPMTDRGCRTKITVAVDGDPEKLWQSWSHGLHRVTCYGDLTADLKRFGRFTGTTLVNEA